MRSRESVEVDLITKQLEYCGKSYDEVISNPSWKSENKISEDDYEDWLEWGVNHMMDSLGFDRRKAEMEMSWFSVKNSVNIL